MIFSEQMTNRDLMMCRYPPRVPQLRLPPEPWCSFWFVQGGVSLGPVSSGDRGSQEQQHGEGSRSAFWLLSLTSVSASVQWGS